MNFPKFIELHWHGEPAAINAYSIALFKDHEFKDLSGSEYCVDESYQEIKKLIESLGCVAVKKENR